jgi:hypothetical protein
VNIKIMIGIYEVRMDEIVISEKNTLEIDGQIYRSFEAYLYHSGKAGDAG